MTTNATYVKTTDFAVKDTLPKNNPAKLTRGTEVDAEFNAISSAVNKKQDSANKGIANGYASLNGSVQVPSTQLRTATQDFDGIARLASFAETTDYSNNRNPITPATIQAVFTDLNLGTDGDAVFNSVTTNGVDTRGGIDTANLRLASGGYVTMPDDGGTERRVLGEDGTGPTWVSVGAGELKLKLNSLGAIRATSDVELGHATGVWATRDAAIDADYYRVLFPDPVDGKLYVGAEFGEPLGGSLVLRAPVGSWVRVGETGNPAPLVLSAATASISSNISFEDNSVPGDLINAFELTGTAGDREYKIGSGNADMLLAFENNWKINRWLPTNKVLVEYTSSNDKLQIDTTETEILGDLDVKGDASFSNLPLYAGTPALPRSTIEGMQADCDDNSKIRVRAGYCVARQNDDVIQTGSDIVKTFSNRWEHQGTGMRPGSIAVGVGSWYSIHVLAYTYSNSRYTTTLIDTTSNWASGAGAIAEIESKGGSDVTNRRVGWLRATNATTLTEYRNANGYCEWDHTVPLAVTTNIDVFSGNPQGFSYTYAPNNTYIRVDCTFKCQFGVIGGTGANVYSSNATNKPAPTSSSMTMIPFFVGYAAVNKIMPGSADGNFWYVCDATAGSNLQDMACVVHGWYDDRKLPY